MFDTKENLAKNARNNAEIHTRHKFIYTVELENKINLCMYLPHLFAESGPPMATTSHLLFIFISHFAAELLLVDYLVFYCQHDCRQYFEGSIFIYISNTPAVFFRP